MCDVSDYAIGAVLRWRDRKHYMVYCASKTLTDAQMNYITIAKELLTIVLLLLNFVQYLRHTCFFYRSFSAQIWFSEKRCKTMTYLVYITALIIGLEIWDQKGIQNVVTNHLSHLTFENNKLPMRDSFPDECLFSIKITHGFADIVNILIAVEIP